MAVEKILIIGAGQMGGGIAQVAAQNGYQLMVFDISEAQIAKLQKSMDKAYGKMVEKGRATQEQVTAWLANISYGTDLEAMAPQADLVIEAATENVSLKLETFAKLDKLCKPECILASNTSSISITVIAAVTKRPEKVIGMHFFNPVPVMKLLELIVNPCTCPQVVAACKAVGAKMGKTIVDVKDSPGFAVNRILIPMINEAIMVLQEGVASATDIDAAMMNGANHPIGPLALADLIGNDTNLAIMQVLYNEFQDPKYRPALLLKQMVAAGKLGRKTGEGFFKY